MASCFIYILSIVNKKKKNNNKALNVIKYHFWLHRKARHVRDDLGHLLVGYKILFYSAYDLMRQSWKTWMVARYLY